MERPASSRRRTRSVFSFVSSHSSEHDALVALQLLDEFSYVLKYNTGSRGSSSVYRCASHVDCGHLLRVVRGRESDAASGEVVYTIEESGAHTEERSGYTRSGIHPAFLEEIDAATAGPKKILQTLKRKYTGDEAMLAALPTMTQIKNRRATKKKKCEDACTTFAMPTLAHLYEWAGMLYCDSAAKFFLSHAGATLHRATDEETFARLDKERQHGTIVLKAFSHAVETEDGGSQQCIGVVLTSRRLFRNLLHAADGHEGGQVVAVVDRTCTLEEGGWVLVAMGSYRTSCVANIREPSKVFVPWVYMMVTHDVQIAYEELYRTVAESARAFFNVDLQLGLTSLDGDVACIADALKTQWPQIALVDSFTRVAGRCEEQIVLARDLDYFMKTISTHIQQLYQARSTEQFVVLATRCVESWREYGEDDFAAWFLKRYVHDRALHWHATSGLPGGLPLEMVALDEHYDTIKTCGVVAASATLGFVLQEAMPKILATVGAQAPTSPFGECFCEGPIPSAMLRQAQDHVRNGAHCIEYHRVNRKRMPRSLVFNSWTRDRLDVTHERVNIYIDSKVGELLGAGDSNDMEQQYLSLHEVEVVGTPEQMKAFKLQLAPATKRDTIREIRSLYRCDCKNFWRTGWVCDHVLAAAALMKQFDLETCLRALGSEHGKA